MLVIGTLTVAANAYVPFPDGTTVELKLYAEVMDNEVEEDYGYNAAGELEANGCEVAYCEEPETDVIDLAYEYYAEDSTGDYLDNSEVIEVKPGQIVWVTCWATTTGKAWPGMFNVKTYYTNGVFLSTPSSNNFYDANDMYPNWSKKTQYNYSLLGATWAMLEDDMRLPQYGLTEAEAQKWHACEFTFDTTPKKTNYALEDYDYALTTYPLVVSNNAPAGAEATICIGGTEIGIAPLVTSYPEGNAGISYVDQPLIDTADGLILDGAVLKFKVAGEAEELDYQPLDAPIAAYEEAEFAGGEDLYTEDSWNAATELYEQAVALKAAQDAADQDEIDNLAAALQEAVDNLEEKETLDFTRLDNDVDTLIPELEEDAYTTSSYEYYADCLAAAQDAQINATTQDEIDTAADDLEEAFYALAVKADMDALEDALDEAAAADTSKWTEDSKTALADAVEYGEALIDMADDIPEDDQAVVDEATQAILDALKNFEEEVEAEADYTAVNEAIDAAAEVNRDLYTAASLKNLDDAVAAVEYGLPESQQAAVDAMAQAINDAIDALKELADTSRLERAIADADAANEADYAADIWAAIEEKVALGNTYIGAGLAADDVQGDIDAITDEINDLLTQMLGDADYSAVEAAINNMPDDFSNYTDESTQAVIDAYDAIVYGLKEDKQGDVDKMASDLAAAINALTLKGADYEYVDKYVNQAATVDRDLYTDDSLAALDAALAAVVRDLDITHQDEVTNMANDLYLALDGLTLKDADYTAVEAAKAKYPADTSIYTADSLKAVDDAIAAVVEGKKADEQDAVDAMAQAIEDAIAALKKLGADYDAVDAAIARANELVQKYYVDFSPVTAAINAVVRDLPVDQQDEIDAMAKAINDAIDALVMKDADYKVVDMAMKGVPSDDHADEYTTESWNALQDAIDAVEYGLKIDRQDDVKAMGVAINNAVKALVKVGPADYTAVNAAIARADGIDADNYTNFRAVEDAIANVTTGLNANHQDEVDAMAQAINDAIDALEKQPANYDELDAAIAEAEDILDEIKDIEDWYINLDEFKDALADAKAVARDLKFDEQDTIDEALAALKTAEDNVEMKPADYTELDAAIAAAADVQKDLYTEESVAAFEKALEDAQAVEKDLLIESQDKIDAAAQALKDAQAALELIPVVGEADYTAVDMAIETFKGYDQTLYTAKSVQDVKNAIAAVVRGKTEDEQADVDAMAKAIEDAIAALVEIGSGNGFVTEVLPTSDTVSASKTKTFEVKVESHAWKIQFIDENGNTWTLARDSAATNSVVSYNAAGEEVNELSRDVAYEIWNVTLTLQPGEYTVISKDSEAGWEAAEDGCKVNVVCTTNDLDVISITPASESVKRYNEFSVDIVTGKDVRKLTVVVNGTDYKTYSASSATTNEDGTLTFHCVAKANAVGTATLAAKVKSADGWTTSDTTKCITVTK